MIILTGLSSVLLLLSSPLYVLASSDTGEVSPLSPPVPDLAPRSAQSPDLIDVHTQPYCGASSCWHWNDDPPVLGKCGLKSVTCPTSDRGKCGPKQYDRDCYCKLKTGLSCAWYCNWTLWVEHEDWLTKVCPDMPPIDFSSLPACARECMEENSFGYGCITQNSNCFCSHGSLFGCAEKCLTAPEKAAIATWLERECAITTATSIKAVEEGTFTIDFAFGTNSPISTEALDYHFGGVVQRAAPKLKWYEILAIVVLVLSFLFVSTVGFLVLRFRKENGLYDDMSFKRK